jgi:hypothetical protein
MTVKRSFVLVLCAALLAVSACANDNPPAPAAPPLDYGCSELYERFADGYSLYVGTVTNVQPEPGRRYEDWDGPQVEERGELRFQVEKTLFSQSVPELRMRCIYSRADNELVSDWGGYIWDDHPPKPGLRLATDRPDLEAEHVALGYRFRWAVELFFRWFNCILGCRHLLSTSPNGITIPLYLGIIASLLISLWTGKKPTNRRPEPAKARNASGWASGNTPRCGSGSVTLSRPCSLSQSVQHMLHSLRFGRLDEMIVKSRFGRATTVLFLSPSRHRGEYHGVQTGL